MGVARADRLISLDFEATSPGPVSRAGEGEALPPASSPVKVQADCDQADCNKGKTKTRRRGAVWREPAGKTTQAAGGARENALDEAANEAADEQSGLESDQTQHRIDSLA